ncbi:MAG TPA: hypothetical protein VGP07_11405 [Polyangia bacterium]|jgi:hypothetical protein
MSALALMFTCRSAAAFTQHGGTGVGNAIPMGHEWITRQAAIELLGGDRVLKDDPADPRKKWTDGRGKAKNINVSSARKEVARIQALKTGENTYAATYAPVWDAIIGERWVDIGGHNLAKSKTVYPYNCLDLVTQEPIEVQYDHYMRQPGDIDGQGGVDAANRSRQTFIKYFVAAATAKAGPMQVWDGGGYSVLVTVDRNYFLLGRALHLFEDSFSGDHTVRADGDRFEKVRQVKSYLCAKGSEQHAHPAAIPPYEDGDVIWKPGAKWVFGTWDSYKPSNMKAVSLVATEAAKDVWAAFIRTMAAPESDRARVAGIEAANVASQWLTVKDEKESITWYTDASHRSATYVKSTVTTEDGGNGRTQEKCMEEDWKKALKPTPTQAQKIAEFQEGQRVCLYNMIPSWGYETEFDPSLHVAYNWTWRDPDHDFVQPPAGWKLSDPYYVKVKLANRSNGQLLRKESDNWLYNDTTTAAQLKQVVEFTVQMDHDMPTSSQGVALQVANDEKHYMNRANTTWGRVGIYQTSSDGGRFQLLRRPDGFFNIKSVYDNAYMYRHSDDRPYINNDGKPENTNAQWHIIGIPEPYPMNGDYKVANTNFQLWANKSGILETDRYQALADYMGLERQGDGSYVLSRGGKFVQISGDKLLMVAAKGSASKFDLDRQADDIYLLRASNGLYWRVDGFGNAVRVDGQLGCAFDPCAPPIISGPDGTGPELDPACKNAPPPPPCKRATQFNLQRDWTR